MILYPVIISSCHIPCTTLISSRLRKTQTFHSYFSVCYKANFFPGQVPLHSSLSGNVSCGLVLKKEPAFTFMSSCCCLKTCGDAELNSCFVVTVFTLWLLLSLYFCWGLLGSDRLLESSKESCGEQGFEPPCLFKLATGASIWLLLRSGRL